MAADSTMFLTMNLFTALSFGTNAPLDSQNTLLTCANVDDKMSFESVSVEINGQKTSRRLRLCKAKSLFQNPLILGLNVNGPGAKTTLEIVHARKTSTRDR